VKIVPDNYHYAKLAVLIKNKSKMSEELVPQIESIIGDSDKATQVYHASRASMGTDVSEIDMVCCGHVLIVNLYFLDEH
jgi:nucleolar protein 56